MEHGSVEQEEKRFGIGCADRVEVKCEILSAARQFIECRIRGVGAGGEVKDVQVVLGIELWGCQSYARACLLKLLDESAVGFTGLFLEVDFVKNPAAVGLQLGQVAQWEREGVEFASGGRFGFFKVLLGLQGHKNSLGHGSLGHHVADAMHTESIGNVEISKRDVLQGVAGRGTGRCQGAFQGKCVLGIDQRMIGDEVGLGCGFDHHFVVANTVTDEGPVAVERVESNVDFHLRREELVRVESRNLSQRQVEGLVPQVARGTASVVRGGENFSMGKVGITASVGACVNGHVALQGTPGFFVVIGHVEKGP